MDTKSLVKALLRAYYIGLYSSGKAARPPAPQYFSRKSTWDCLGLVLGHLGPVLGRLGAVLRSWKGHLGQSWAAWGHLGAVLGGLGPSWAVLGPFWTVLGRLGAE